MQRMGGPTLYSDRKGQQTLISRHKNWRVDQPAAERWLHHMEETIKSLELDDDTMCVFRPDPARSCFHNRVQDHVRRFISFLFCAQTQNMYFLCFQGQDAQVFQAHGLPPRCSQGSHGQKEGAAAKRGSAYWPGHYPAANSLHHEWRCGIPFLCQLMRSSRANGVQKETADVAVDRSSSSFKRIMYLFDHSKNFLVSY